MNDVVIVEFRIQSTGVHPLNDISICIDAITMKLHKSYRYFTLGGG